LKNKKPNRKNKSNLWLIAGAIILLSGIAWFSLRPSQAPGEGSSQPQLSSLKIPTLPPEMFTGKARDAYQVAKEIPEVLSQVQCYCGCKESDGHQSNFFCFTDQHGAG
jgi:hypothetical protein